jgi:predicted LPLAT superfamily acyltransferase
MQHKVQIKKRGNALGFWFFRTSLRLFGLRGTYGFLYFVCLHYLLFDKEAVSGALAYVKRVFRGARGPIAYLHVYRLFVSQGKQLIDRYAAISGARRFKLDLLGYELLAGLSVRPGQGFVLLTAHCGNWQIALSSLKNLDKVVYLLMRPQDNAALEESLRISGITQTVKVISPESELGGVVAVMSALEKGNIVSIMGDRSYDFNRTEVDFLGEKAGFPYGAFAIAAASKVPVVALFCAKVGHGRYLVDAESVFEPVYTGGKDKKEQLKVYVQAFAGRLEKFVRQYPYQCFLFQDIWQKN